MPHVQAGVPPPSLAIEEYAPATLPTSLSPPARFRPPAGKFPEFRRHVREVVWESSAGTGAEEGVGSPGDPRFHGRRVGRRAGGTHFETREPEPAPTPAPQPI